MAIVVSEERGQIALAMNGRIDRALSADELRERLRHVRHAAARRRARGVSLRRLMAYHPFRHLGLKFVALVLRQSAVADRRRRARRRAHPARAGGVPQHSRAARSGRRPARQRRGPAARLVGAAQPPAARRGRRDGRSPAGASGLAAVSTSATKKCDRRTASRSRRCMPGTLGIELEKTGDAHGAGGRAARRRTGAGLRHRRATPQSRRWSRSPARRAASRRSPTRRPSRCRSPARGSTCATWCRRV